jgi:uncharacterized protein YjbI with pentapeptide repeats
MASVSCVGAVDQVIEWDDEALEHALTQAAEGIVQARGVRLSAKQLERLLEAAPRHPEDPRYAQLKSADFRGAVFTKDADFARATFSGDARFDGATFSGRNLFDGATFSGRFTSFYGATFSGFTSFGRAIFSKEPTFDGATFSGFTMFDRATFTEGVSFAEPIFGGDASFGGATFSGNALFDRATFGEGTTLFDGATFSGYASFVRTTFSGYATFVRTNFSGDARFVGATFSRDAIFGGATFGGDAIFGGATFSGDARFGGSTFSGDAIFRDVTCGESAHFVRATFEVAAEFGPVHVYDRLWLDEAVFAQRVRIEASALRASFARMEFRRGADVRLRWAEVWLEDTNFAEPSLFAPLPARRTLERGKAKAFLGWERPARDGRWCWTDEPTNGFGPRVLSLGGSRVANLTLSGVDLKACRFAGAHGLDDLGLERVEFPLPPVGWRWLRWWPMRWTRRQTIAEEHHWRARRSHGRGWDHGQLPTTSPDPWPPQPPPQLEPDRIAGIYRALRKSREDSKDEPGANDFYYGEMEMRRRSGPRAERLLLLLYWLVSGYGLRASRALLALAVTIAVLGAIPLALWGFRPHLQYGRALLFALQSSISLLRAPTRLPAHQTAGGQVIEIFLRLAGPLFFGLALLALRGRVKR